MKKLIEKVEEFHSSFNIKDNKNPSLIDMSEYRLRHKLMEEENNEYLDACSQHNLVEVADALGDQLYILCGTILKHGMQHVIEKVFNEIHTSNMSKLDEQGNPIINGENGYLDETRPIGKVLKSDKYKAPNIKPILDEG